MEDKGRIEKTAALRPPQKVTVDFTGYPYVLRLVSDLAKEEIRPLDLQIIYLLKRHFDKT